MLYTRTYARRTTVQGGRAAERLPALREIFFGDEELEHPIHTQDMSQCRFCSYDRRLAEHKGVALCTAFMIPDARQVRSLSGVLKF